ncbi:hypothetical protein N7528_003827 [Penicillium herquei]|nr:hypothetical protein N7528_003827 [Penicillium herquei]
MSLELQSSLDQNSVDKSLQKIDDESKYPYLPPGNGSFIGPFGVLRFSRTSNLIADCSGKTDSAQAGLEESCPLESTWSQSLSSGISDLTGDLNNIDPSLNWPDLFDINLSWADLSFDNLSNQSLDDMIMVNDVGQAREVLSSTNLPESISSDFGLGNFQISEAQMLLRRYKDTIVAQLFSLPLYEMSPWEEINIDAAVLTVGRISYMGIERVSNAAMSNLLALIAISAGHMAAEILKSGKEGHEYWTTISLASYAKGKDHLQKSLYETENIPPPKYKEQMMAISAMLSFSILFDYREEARAYLIDSERLLRLRGLRKSVFSRKARLLHHIYTWNRILGESTYVFQLQNMERQLSASSSSRNRPAQPKGQNLPRCCHFPSNPKVHLDNFLRLDDELVDSEVEDGKTDGGVLNAMHIEESREGTRAMYRQLYGVSETWLSLVSKTTRLANILDKLKLKSPSQKPKILQPLESYKSQLEDLIWDRVTKDEPPSYSPDNIPTLKAHQQHGSLKSAPGNPASYMVHALNLGLLIFFYRRIRESNPRLLQPYVSSIIQSLKDFATSCNALGIGGPGSPWPAFMAGCEAMSSQDRDYLSTWMDEVFLLTGFTRFQTIKKCTEEVWRENNYPRPLYFLPHEEIAPEKTVASVRRTLRDVVEFAVEPTSFSHRSTQTYTIQRTFYVLFIFLILLLVFRIEWDCPTKPESWTGILALHCG